MTVVERALLLAEQELFATTRTEDLAHLAAAAREDEYATGEVVYQHGDRPDGMHLVVSGSVKLTREGTQLVVGPETAFGVFGLLDGEARGFTATAGEPTRLLSIDRHDFLDVVADNVSLARGLFEALALRVRKSSPDTASERDRIAAG